MRIAFIIPALALATAIGCGSQREVREDSQVVLRGEAALDGTFNYEIVGSGNVSPEARDLHKQARRAGSAGKYDEAVETLKKAAVLAPEWPYPVYDLAFTYLLMDDAENALTYYQKTVELSPRGFFTAITACDTLQREQKGELPPGTYKTFLSLEWTQDDVAKRSIVEKLVQQTPTFAPGWKALALMTDAESEKLQAIEHGLSNSPDAETKGMLQINKALLRNGQGKHDEAVTLLETISKDPTTTFANEQLAKFTLKNIIKK
jgi:tetratricopeptide (TPR) repeat protein